MTSVDYRAPIEHSARTAAFITPDTLRGQAGRATLGQWPEILAAVPTVLPPSSWIESGLDPGSTLVGLVALTAFRVHVLEEFVPSEEQRTFVVLGNDEEAASWCGDGSCHMLGSVFPTSAIWQAWAGSATPGVCLEFPTSWLRVLTSWGPNPVRSTPDPPQARSPEASALRAMMAQEWVTGDGASLSLAGPARWVHAMSLGRVMRVRTLYVDGEAVADSPLLLLALGEERVAVLAGEENDTVQFLQIGAAELVELMSLAARVA